MLRTSEKTLSVRRGKWYDKSLPSVRLKKHREESAMLSYIWPIALIVLSNTLYQICAKSVPEGMNPFASLTVTYLVAALASGILYFAIGPRTGLLKEYSKLNWAPFVLGIVIVGLEAGYIFAFKAGWQVSTAQVVQAAILAGGKRDHYRRRAALGLLKKDKRRKNTSSKKQLGQTVQNHT